MDPLPGPLVFDSPRLGYDGPGVRRIRRANGYQLVPSLGLFRTGVFSSLDRFCQARQASRRAQQV